MSSQSNLLVVDYDINYLESINIEQTKSNVIPLPICTSEAAMDVIKDSSINICGVFINTGLPDYGWLRLIQAMHGNRAGVPIFLTKNSKVEITDIDTDKIGIQNYVDRPTSFSDLVKLIDPMLVGFDSDAAIKKSGGGKAVETDSGEFVGILARNFLSGSKSLFDIYVALSSTKFIKICSAGAEFDEGRVIGYIKKGVEYFYIRKSAQDIYLEYCEHLTSRILNNSKVSTEIKAAQTLNLGQVAADLISSAGLNENQLKYAKSYVSNVQNLISQMNLQDNKVMKKFMEDVSSYEHGVAVAMVTGILAKEMGFETTYGIETLGLASLLHDIGFVALSDELRHEDESRMTPEQINEYRKHPQLGAAILNKMEGISEAVVQGVAHHHVRKNQMGFPTNVSFGKTNTIAQLVGISCEYVHALEMVKRDPNYDILGHMEESVLPGFSLQISRKFKECFLSA